MPLPTNTILVPDYVPSARQTIFHTTIADEKLYGGAAGGGKTAAIVAEAGTLAIEYPGIPVNLFRRTIPELKATIIPEIQRQFGAYIKAGHMTWHGQDRKYILRNGSSITLNYLDNDNDIYRYQGTEMPIIAVDELTQFPQSWIEYLLTRNRTSNADWPIMFIAGTNPGGIGHGWVKTRYIDPVAPETIQTVLLESGHKVTRVFIPAKVSDHPNAKFRDDYERKLASISDPQLRRALWHGDWDVFAGQVFTEWRYDKHVIDPFDIPKHWQRWRSMDHGNNNTVLWYARDPSAERVFIYREYRTTNYTEIGEKARIILQLESGDNISYGLADPSIWAKGQGDMNTGRSIAQLYEDHGVKWMPANNDRKAGLEICHKMLAVADDGYPHCLFFSTCLSSIRTIPSLPYDRLKVDDVDTKADDHDYDAWRYGLMSNAIKEEQSSVVETDDSHSYYKEAGTLIVEEGYNEY